MVSGIPNISVKSEMKKAVASPAFRHSPRRRGRVKPSTHRVKSPATSRPARQSPYQDSKGILWRPGTSRRVRANSQRPTPTTRPTKSQRTSGQTAFIFSTDPPISGLTLRLAERAENHPKVLPEAAVDLACPDPALFVDDDVPEIGHVHPVAFHPVRPDHFHGRIG